MTPLVFMIVVFAICFGAGLFGALLGLGGGIIVVPALTLLLHVDIRYAIGASIVSVIATSSGAGASYVKDQLANIRLGMFLETATTLGALSGAFVAGIIGGRWLYLSFGAALGYAAVLMWRGRNWVASTPTAPDHLADALQLHGSYHDLPAEGAVSYRVGHSVRGFALSSVAGLASGLLGIGGGVIKVPVMAIGMGVPIKAASATSNFMIGVTAAASAGVYFARGDVDPFIAAPTALGVLAGSLLGARLIRRVHHTLLQIAFTVVLIVIAAQMVREGFRLP
jgi:uncharacterized protein